MKDNPAMVYISTLSSERSRQVMLESLDIAASLLTDGRVKNALEIEWRLLRYPHMAALRALLVERYSPSTVNRILSALRGVLKAAWRLGQMTSEEYYRTRDVQNVRNEVLPAGRELGEGEIMALVAACKRDKTAAGVRDAALLALLCACGLRRAEVVALDVDDYNAEDGQLKIRRGKGRKQRTVYVHGGAARALGAWLALHPDETQALFLPVNKGGNIGKRRITSQAVYNMLKKRAKEAGVDAFSPHDLRRTFVSNLLARGADVAIVAQLAGHSDVNVTARYDRRPEEAKRQAASLLHFPY
ncbi:MAG: site-specific integrase [Chloroflexi bacterium]|nr:MAG: site-specific integrase [Chloroflexota bacterium]